MYAKILAAIDGSDNSLRAVDHARAIAERFNATLILVHAYPHTSDLRGYADFAKLVARRKKAGQAIIDRVREQLGDTPFPIQETLLEGPESDAILRVAESQTADLIVMGTRGLGALKGALLGSVSRKVLHYAACSVMVVK
jgi:nucleotide-binding universal stress UspA family protein